MPTALPVFGKTLAPDCPVRVGAGGLASQRRDGSAGLVGEAVAAGTRNPEILLGDLNGTVDDRGPAPVTSPMNVAERASSSAIPPVLR